MSTVSPLMSTASSLIALATSKAAPATPSVSESKPYNIYIDAIRAGDIDSPSGHVDPATGLCLRVPTYRLKFRIQENHADGSKASTTLYSTNAFLTLREAQTRADLMTRQIRALVDANQFDKIDFSVWENERPRSETNAGYNNRLAANPLYA